MSATQFPATAGSGRDLVVIGASAGGVETLKRVVAGLPVDLAATVCVVLHIAPSSPSVLAKILDRSGPLSCHQATDREELRPGEILVAPPDRHLEIDDDRARLTIGPRENGHRPAVDTLFRSAAHARAGRVIGVVLSGNRHDGAAGLATIKARGGATIVQDPDEALYSGMPASALAHVSVDAVVPSKQIAAMIAAMVRTADSPPSRLVDDLPGSRTSQDRAITVCPDCGGVLTEEREAEALQWRCHVGHRYSAESLADAQAASVERAAVRALEEPAALMERMAQNFGRQPGSATRFQHKASDAVEQAGRGRAVFRRAAAVALSAVDEDDAEDDEQEASL